MLSADDNENKPIGKPSQRKASAKAGAKPGATTSVKAGTKPEAGKKSEPRKRKDTPAGKPDQLLEALQRLGAQTAEDVTAPIIEEAVTPVVPSESSGTEPLPESNLREVQVIPAAVIPAAKPAEAAASVSLQTIADAYGDYSKKSLEQTSSFVARLVSARSLDKAFELQTSFAREAYETFVAESKRIRELHRELAKQRLTRLEGFVGMTRPR
jgi:hypothetical protein